MLNPDQTLLPPDALRARFARAGVDGSRPLVTSCGSGVTACVLTLGLAVAGLPTGAVPNSVTALGLLWLASRRTWLRERWAA